MSTSLLMVFGVFVGSCWKRWTAWVIVSFGVLETASQSLGVEMPALSLSVIGVIEPWLVCVCVCVWVCVCVCVCICRGGGLAFGRSIALCCVILWCSGGGIGRWEDAMGRELDMADGSMLACK